MALWINRFPADVERIPKGSVRTRFAPPTGYMHVGTAYRPCTLAHRPHAGGTFILH